MSEPLGWVVIEHVARTGKGGEHRLVKSTLYTDKGEAVEARDDFNRAVQHYGGGPVRYSVAALHGEVPRG
ncbi:hypothetical protein [Nonomuraea sp. NPDC050310]|uniref:hypothetical protein n=1 Tax=Nonomuraea sp. NPDC050310 TaxID=3154935 RepID=UPI0033C8975C